MASEPRWTPPEDLRDLIAGATEQHHIVAGQTDAMGNNPCVCGQWWDAAGDNPGWDQHMADVALVALHAAGLLVTPELTAVVDAARTEAEALRTDVRVDGVLLADTEAELIAAVDALDATTGAGT